MSSLGPVPFLSWQNQFYLRSSTPLCNLASVSDDLFLSFADVPKDMMFFGHIFLELNKNKPFLKSTELAFIVLLKNENITKYAKMKNEYSSSNVVHFIFF